MKRVSLLFFVLSLVGFLSVQGCGGEDESTAGSQVERCDGDALCVGVLLPSPQEVSFSDGLQEAAKAAEAHIADAGGKIELRFGVEGDCDDYSVPQAAVQKLIDAGVHAIVGHVCSGVSDSIINEVEGIGNIIMISPANTAAAFSSGADKYKYYFRTAPSDVLQARILADKLDPSMATYAVYRDDLWGEGLNAQFAKQRAYDGAKSYHHHSSEGEFDHETEGIEEFLATAAGTNPANVILLAFDEGTDILKRLLTSNRISRENKYYVADGFYNILYELKDDLSSLEEAGLQGELNPEKLVQLLYANSSGFLTTTPGSFTYLPEDPLSNTQKEFAEKNKNTYSPYMYDAVVLLALASVKAGGNEVDSLAEELVKVSRDGERCISYQDCASATGDIDYDGLSGPIDFDGNGDVTRSIYSVLTYMGGSLTETTEEP